MDELADFTEWLAWKQGRVSTREVLAALGRLDENDCNEGCDDNADGLANDLDDVMCEIGRRMAASNGAYPFLLNHKGTVVDVRSPDSELRMYVYFFLLLGTRLDMRANRTHGGVDGAELLEHLAACVLENYLGGCRGGENCEHPNLRRARSLVFGTANRGRFSDKVSYLCDQLGEGEKFEARDTGQVTAQDDKLDVVAWVPFSDKRGSQLIIFGQCKTGTHYDSQLTQLQPEAFIKLWIKGDFLLIPVRAFIISESLTASNWSYYCVYGGLFFDRCRIVDFCHNLDDVLLSKIKSWTEAAKNSLLI
jgi:hypothetical protein